MSLFDALKRVVRPKADTDKPATSPDPAKPPATSAAPAAPAAESAAPRPASPNTTQFTRSSQASALPAAVSNQSTTDADAKTTAARPAPKAAPSTRRVLFVDADQNWFQ